MLSVGRAPRVPIVAAPMGRILRRRANMVNIGRYVTVPKRAVTREPRHISSCLTTMNRKWFAYVTTGTITTTIGGQGYPPDPEIRTTLTTCPRHIGASLDRECPETITTLHIREYGTSESSCYLSFEVIG